MEKWEDIDFIYDGYNMHDDGDLDDLIFSPVNEQFEICEK